MAITRCPYCHAIIDENVKYCNNCGTQLLFSEDVDAEEEIPGEKIIDADTEEKDYTIEEPAGGSKPKEDPDLDEEIEEETEELALDKLLAEDAEKDDEDLTEEVILVDEIKAVEAGGKGEAEEPEDKEETTGLKDADKEKSEEEEEKDEEEEAEEEDKDLEEDEEITEAGEAKEPAEDEEAVTPATPALEEPPVVKPEEPPTASEEAEPVIEYLADDKDRDAAEPDEEALPQPVTFDTQELEGIGKTVELGKEKIDKFLEVLAEKEAEVEPPPKSVREPTGTLPPWASTMKGAPVFPDETGPAGSLGQAVADATAPAGEDEVEIFPRRRDSDSTIGLPERVSQSPLPFEQGAAEEEEGEVEEEPDDDEAREKILPTAGPVRTEREAVRPTRESERREAIAEAEVEGEEPAPRPPFRFSTFFKSKAFDVLFVGLFWLVALWLAANSMDATLFDILGSMSGSMLLLYAVFVFIYFFLFKFFLGETLGDRLFRERE